MFSFFGHVFETILWVGINGDANGWHLALIPMAAEPFGFGALAILWFIYPLVRSHKLGVFGTFIAGAILTTAIEFICAAVIVAFLGSNPYWDYSTITPFNLFGFVCLHNALGFGLMTLIFVYFGFPWLDRVMEKIGRIRMNTVFWVLFVSYAVSLAAQTIWGVRIIL
jgi:uncharacterized membrane protein